MTHLDYEWTAFQRSSERRIMIATYSAGSVGTTFTAATTTVYDDLPSDCKEDIQAEDRTDRLEEEIPRTHNTLQYYQMQARYPEKFLERMRKTWIRKSEKPGVWEEFEGKGTPPNDEENPWQTAYDTFFAQGTYDQVHHKNLANQRLMFHLINDGFADERSAHQDDMKFVGLENGNGKAAGSDAEAEEEHDY